LALVWNTRDEDVAWVAALSAILDRYEGDVPRQARHRGTEVFAGTTQFTPFVHRRFPYAQDLDRAGLADRVASISFIAALEQAERDRVLQEVDALVTDLPDP